jgi:hypothetical protein
MKRLKLAIRLLAAFTSLALIAWARPSQRGEPCGAELQIDTGQGTYSAGSIMHVRFIVTNRGTDALYLFRGISNCSSQLGSLYLGVFDNSGHEVNTSGCSTEAMLKKMDVVRALNSPGAAVMLKSQELHVFDADFKLPAKRGVYVLKAELTAPAFSSEQRQVLAQKGMRVLGGACIAPIVKITLK